MKRRQFLSNTAIIGAGVLTSKFSFAAAPFPVVREAASKRNFTSKSVELAISEFSAKVKNPELAWLFNNCFPNTLDTTVTYKMNNGRPDTYVITGDIDAMWLRDSTAQVWPYITFINKDPELKQLVAGVINRQTTCILRDPYANAFYDDPNKTGEWKDDVTDMKPGLHERKWEIDSLCYPIRLAYRYWKLTGDNAPFDAKWKSAIQSTLKTFKEQQRKTNDGPYSFQRKTSWATDGVPMNGFGYPVKPVGLICSSFRPSDDATVYSFLVPSNFFAVSSLKQASEMVKTIHKDAALATQLWNLAAEVSAALQKHAIINHPEYGRIYAYEVNGFGSFNLMDDANVPSLLAMPYLGSVKNTDLVYLNTRKMLLSLNNPFFFKGKAGEGIGGPHAGKDMIWPISITVRALTSTSDAEIKECIELLRKTHAGTGFMHESFHKDDASKFTRKWFAWANTLFGELLWETYKTKPALLT
ncbi:glycoside hydrolase family 125 protein [Mucilaginibacter terrenus]|uniref:Glycoside hydrolase family 125 protein n=1 Tax=Mucilaginibacter terrenus TaxID=2482727 RepID=A0A3E2NSX2_9SPHI|nr:glycoside hydrolase family 125 protein [Mucilaginibacter terrenus]RFZ84094.1 glycoside hydrolase family 125 protein [Mucilaginibacter terrenus]